jgi:hypothetical protein
MNLPGFEDTVITCDKCGRKYDADINWRNSPKRCTKVEDGIEKVYISISICQECFEKQLRGEDNETNNSKTI